MISLFENLWLNILIIPATLITVVLLYIKWSFTYWSRKGVQTITPSLPFGNISEIFFQKSDFASSTAQFYREFKSRGLKYGGIYFFSQPVLVVLDPELIKHILTKDFQYFMDRTIYINEKGDPLSANLFGLKGSKWKTLRAKLTPTFTSGKMKMMFQTLVDCSVGLNKIIDFAASSDSEVHIKDVVARYTTDVIGSCAFGIDCNCLENPDSEFRKIGDKIFKLTIIESFKSILGQTWPKLMQFFNMKVINEDVSRFIKNITKETIDYREKNKIVRKDFMQLLIQLKNYGKIEDENHVGNGTSESVPNGTSLTVEQIAAQTFVFFAAGFETSATTLTFCLFETVINPEIQEKLREEIQTVLKKYDGKVTYEAIAEMTYMEKCVQETLRKYPPLPLLQRLCTKSYRVPDTDLIIDEGTHVFVPIYAIQNDVHNYPRPQHFDPVRFNEENKAKRHPYLWLPFGEGPRICIGLRFGIMQVKVALTALFKNYKYTLDSKTVTPLEMDPSSFIISTLGKILLKVEKI